METAFLCALRTRRAPPPAGYLFRMAAACGLETRKDVVRAAVMVTAGAATAYVAYRAYCKTVATCKAVRRWWLGPIKMAPAPQHATIDGAVGSFKSETAMPGSEEVSLTPPACQAVVGYEQDNKFYVVGCATRIDEWLVMPDHVKAAAALKQLELRGVADGKGLGFKMDKALLDSFVMLDTDLLATRLTEADFSRVGLRKVTVTPSLDETHGAFVQIVGPYGKGTTGNLSHHQIFGKTIYTGSTFEGYSGSPYMAGRHVAGIHLHGGQFNGGYSASYILCMLKHHWKVHDEDTAEWLQTYVKDKRNVVWDNSYLDDEDVRVRVAGRYHIVRRDNMARVWGNDWARHISREQRTKHYYDYESIPIPTAGEVKPRLSLGGSSSPGKLDPYIVELAAAGDWKGLQSYAQQLWKAKLPQAPPRPSSS